MKIIIETPTEEEPEMVFEYVKEKCIEALQEFELSIEETDLKYKQEKKDGKDMPKPKV